MKEIAKILLDIKAVTLSPKKPYIWASGIKSPIYCDNRLLLSHPEEWRFVISQMIRTIKKEFPEVECIMGTAAAGIPHASVCSYEMNLPGGFVRASSKDHGKGNQVEGKVSPGMKTVVIEDLISTGGSSLAAVKVLEEAGCQVLGIVSIFTYGMEKAQTAMSREGIRCLSLTDYPELLSQAVQCGYLEENEVKGLIQFMKDPSDESWIQN
jgi:orotate phosphoribosyltransferase